MSKSHLEFLRHAIDEMVFLQKEAQKISEEQFMHDDVLERAFARSLEIIGEAIKQVPEEVRTKYPDIDWKAYAGLRDKLIHHYFGVDYALVWDVILHELPQLKEKLSSLLAQEQKD